MPVAAGIYYSLHTSSYSGPKPPIVLLHGAGGTHLYWPPEMRRLAGWNVYAPDLPGHGQSSGSGQQTISGYTSTILDWLQAMGLHSAIFVGHSMGSAIAISLALDHANHVIGLGLLGAGARLRVASEILENAANPETHTRAVEVVVQWAFSPAAPAQLVALAGKRMAETRSSVLYGDFLACNAFNEIARIEQIRSPVLIVCGVDDYMTPVRYSQFLANHIPGAVLNLIPAAGHMVMLEQPQAVSSALNEFLGSISY